MKRTTKQQPSTPPITFLSGAFNLSNWKVPYFSTIMTLGDAARHLHLTAELPGAESVSWKVEELYQRDIDWVRVERQILPYLNNVEQPQFFSSIIIALLPYDNDKRELLTEFNSFTSGSYQWDPPLLEDSDTRFEKNLSIGPISFRFWEDWKTTSDSGFQHGELCWNTRQIYGVAIDGQHRLAAIKSRARTESASTIDTRVPVVLLVFAEELGFKTPKPTNQIEVLRRLFIDLNKHSKQVSRARQVLLDDRDPIAVCVRQLVANELSADLSDLHSSPPHIPLSLVDWHSEQARFDSGPYVTTILGLDWIISKVLESKPVYDFTEYRQIATQISKIEANLDVDLADAGERIRQLQKLEQGPFSYNDEELNQIKRQFGEIWSSPICNILTKLAPYNDLIATRNASSSLSLDFQHWYQLRLRAEADKYSGNAQNEYREFLDRVSNRGDNSITESQLKQHQENIEVLKRDNLAFNVAFQRALIYAFLEFAKVDFTHIAELSDYAPDDEEIDFEVDFEEDAYFEEEGDVDLHQGNKERDISVKLHNRSQIFVEAMNTLISEWPEFLDVEATFSYPGPVGDVMEDPFWLGTLFNVEGRIDFTQGASGRAKELLFAIAAMYLYDLETDPDRESDFNLFWDNCHASEGAPMLCRRVKRSINRYSDSKGQTSAAYRILRFKDGFCTPQRALEQSRIRLEFLWNKLGL